MNLKQARHPLLGDKAVPIDVCMEQARILVITGPNTGGKTVALKTIGLFALMNQFGLALPVAEGSGLPLFDGVFAEIGDEQSLEHSLSTFSAHISAVSSIVEGAGAASLVLLDELCAGTDGQEGSAIAMAVLDRLLGTGSLCVVTTHHGALKNYAFSKDGVENASVEFDASTLTPTYRIVMGLPGESRALDISLHYGLSPEIVGAARSYLDEGRGDVSALIAGLKEKLHAATAREQELSAEKRYLQEERRKADLRELRLRQKETQIKAGSVGSLRALLDESRKTLENLVRELKEGEVTREKTLKVKNFLQELEFSVEIERENLENQEIELKLSEKAASTESNSEQITHGTGEIKAGIQVLAGEKKLRGLVRRQAKKGLWVVEIGSVSMTFPETELVSAEGRTTEKSRLPAVSIDYEIPAGAVCAELDLRGMRLGDALESLMRQIEAAVLGGLHEFAVIHGKGDGILQRGIHDFLRTDARIADYYFSRPEFGGFGRTEVMLKT